MGMLMHHTWLNEQKKKSAKPVAEPVAEKAAEETKEPETEVKKTGGRRKASK